MPVTPNLLKSTNEEIQSIPIAETRWPELAIELNQLRAASEASLVSHDFDRDPADYAALLRRTWP